MSSYTFENLSPIDFEDLSRDLIQERESIIFESFSEGKDSGIDFRHSENKNNNIIIQCKRYKDYKSLLFNLKTELTKVKKLKLKRYILTTSVKLSVKNKKDLVELFHPYIINSKDILGREDLINLLKKYPDVEKNNFKLWFLGANVLNEILKSKIRNQSNFEKETIERDVKIYVKNESFHEALGILGSNNFVVISGIPGIGKTTLARMLVYHFLGMGFQEFIYLSKSIDEGYDLYSDLKKQVFLFDDFLGRTFLENNFQLNEDKRIIAFIKKIKESKNKILIFTTREYILNQAKSKYDLFESEKLKIAKCILDLEKYSKIIKAQILYNHLLFANLPIEYVQNILRKKRYFKIINHPNYSPRIIELMTKKDSQKEVMSDNFFNKFIKSLDNPEDIWKHAYENQILDLSQFILIILLVSRTPMPLKKLDDSIQFLSQKLNEKYGKCNKKIFSKSIKELEDSFIRIYKNGNDELLIEFQNASIQDFLTNFLKQDKNLIEDILKNTNIFDHLFSIFSLDEKEDKIYINKQLLNVIVERILNDFNELFIVTPWFKGVAIDLKKIYTIFLFNFDNIKINDFIIKKFKSIDINDLDSGGRSEYLDMLSLMEQEDLNLNREELISKFVKELSFFEDVENFTKIQDIFPEEYNEYINNNNDYINNIIIDIAVDIDTSPDDTDEMIERVVYVENHYDIDLSNTKLDLEESRNEHLQRIYDQLEDDNYYKDRRIEEKIDDDQITGMFNTLKH
ncbi:MAG: restriction endonuclease [bacterium]|nr:restriction endonuclease [bacterium]